MKAAFFDLDRALLQPEPWPLRLRRLARAVRPDSRLHPRALLRRQARALLAAHQWRGHVIVLLTSGSAEWGQLAADELDADGVLNVPAGSDPGLWRGSAVRQFCHRYGFVAAASFGYGGSDADWLWLETLGHPTAVNPSGKLRRRAREARWPIMNLDRGDVRLDSSLGAGSAPPCVSLT